MLRLLDSKSGACWKKISLVRGLQFIVLVIVLFLWLFHPSFPVALPHNASPTLPGERSSNRQPATMAGPKAETTFPPTPPTPPTTVSNDVLPNPTATQLPEMESIRGTSITWPEIRSNFATCYREAVKRNPQCREVHKNPRDYWRSTHNATGHEVNFLRMDLASRCCAFNHSELMSPTPSNTMDSWEKDYLSQGPLKNVKDTAWASRSNLTLLTKGPFQIGQRVRFFIQVVNGWGQPRRLGGDIVYLWLVNQELEASVSAEVEDQGNGQYIAKVTLPWSGMAVVKATIAYTRELLRSVLYVRRLFTTFHWFSGIFKNNSSSEATPCSSLPRLPAFPKPEVCNLTEMNGGIPWYCGKPVKQQLMCEDWYGTQRMSEASYMPLSEEDSEWVKLNQSQRPVLIPTRLVLNISQSVQGQTVIETPKTPCGERNLSTTFDYVMSTGFYYKQNWYPFACHLPRLDREFLLECLHNTTVIILGDSNSRAQMDILTEMTGCIHKIPRDKEKWHSPLRCEVDSIGISILYYPPKNPFYGSVDEIVTNSQLTSFITRLESIPSEGRYIVHLHQFLHLVSAHLSIADQRVRTLRPVLVRLLNRNRQVFVVIQSPHLAHEYSEQSRHEMESFLFEIQRTVLKGLGDRVMFVNTFDMTVARENQYGHPSFSKDFTTLYFGHVCNRQ